ncbi:MAG: Ktr system potassium uptake protein B [Desulfovibrio sp.]
MYVQRRFTLPFILPIASFAAAIFAGALLLWLTASVSFIDAFFTATSAVCVTGLASVDIGTVFSPFGHAVILALVQLGGLGITTYSTLIFYLASRRISLTDRLAVGDALLNDASFNLGTFLQRIVVVIFALEICGAALLHALDPERISPFAALFIAVSAFCNAGFALWQDNLIHWRQSWPVTGVVMTLIVCGGLGFAVLDELLRRVTLFCRKQPLPPLSFHARLVLRTTAFLIITGTLLLMLPEYFANDADPSSLPELVLPSLFQSVTARTAGFNTVIISSLTDVSLLVLILLMLIGGSPGSCAGGIKTTTFRVLIAFVYAHLRGRSQTVVNGKAVDAKTLNKTMLLVIFTLLTILAAVFALALTEGGAAPHGKTPFQVLDLLFEAASAFGTVGLTTDVTPRLSTAGKLIDCALMYVGRLGPIWLITTIQQMQTEPRYQYPERNLPIG